MTQPCNGLGVTFKQVPKVKVLFVDGQGKIVGPSMQFAGLHNHITNIKLQVKVVKFFQSSIISSKHSKFVNTKI